SPPTSPAWGKVSRRARPVEPRSSSRSYLPSNSVCSAWSSSSSCCSSPAGSPGSGRERRTTSGSGRSDIDPLTPAPHPRRNSMKRSARKLALVLSLALVVGAGCGGGGSKNNNASNTNSSTAAKSDIKVGAIFDLSGPTADVGTPYSEGIRDYVDWKNGQGGVDGHKINMMFQDYGYKVPQAEQLYSQYVSQGAKVFIGWGTGDSEALKPKVNADKIPFMSASYAETLADPKVTPYNFFPGASYSQQMRIALQWIADNNSGKHVEVAVFHNDSPFGTSPLDDGKKYIADHKLNLGFKNYPMPAGATDFVAQIGQAKSQGAKYIIVQNVASPAAKLAQNLKSQNSDMQLMCLNWCAD